MCLDTVTYMNETLNTVASDNYDAVIDLEYDKNFHNGLSDYDNESQYIPIAPTIFEEYATPMISDEDAVNHIPRNPPQCDRGHGCAHGTVART